MASQLRVNKSENRSGLGTITYTDTGAIVSGIVTANSFSGDIIGNITGAVTGTTGSFSGDVSIAEKIIHTGDTNTFMKFDTDIVTFETAGDERIRRAELRGDRRPDGSPTGDCPKSNSSRTQRVGPEAEKKTR